MYLLWESERRMFLYQLYGESAVSREEQEQLYWDFLKFLNTLEKDDEQKQAMSVHTNGTIKTRQSSVADINYGIFWDEYRSIELSQSTPQQTADCEDGADQKDDSNDDSSIQWLSDVGFKNIAKKFREKTEIDQNDNEMKIIAASLTRAQANAVRRRIDSLNEAIRLRKLDQSNPVPSKVSSKRRDVRNIFSSQDVKTKGESTKSEEICADNSRRTGELVSTNVKRFSHFVSEDVKHTAPPPPTAPKPMSSRSINQRHSISVPTVDITRSNSPERKGHQRGNSSPTLQRLRNQTPQVDNLVRRTSGSHLILRSGEEREKSLLTGSKNTGNPIKIKRPQSEVIPSETKIFDKEDDFYKPISQRIGVYENRRVSATIETKVNIKSKNLNKRFSASNDQLLDKKNFDDKLSCKSLEDIKSTVEDERKLVIVDSKFIDVKSFHKEETIKENITQTKPMAVDNRKTVTLNIEENRPLILPTPTSPRDNQRTLSDLEPDIQRSRVSDYEPDIQRTRVNSEPNKQNTRLVEQKVISKTQSSPSRSPLAKRTSPQNDLQLRSSTALSSGSDDSKSVSSSLGSLGSFEDVGGNIKYKSANTSNESPGYQQNNLSHSTLSPSSSSDLSPVASPISSSPRLKSPEIVDVDGKMNIGGSSPKESNDAMPDSLNGPTFPPLPNFTLAKDELGLTNIGDLSDADMEKVKSLALIELTALFDTYEIPMHRKKAPSKLKYKDNGVFGVPLTVLCQREQSKKNPVVRPPRIFTEMLNYIERNGLQEEGLLRIPGAVPRVKAFREEADKNDINLINWETKKISDIATCLKQFLRDLPVPLLSFEYQNTFTSVGDLPNRKVQLQALNLLVLLLNPAHQETLKVFLIFLNKVIAKESLNKMGLNNVAMIMAPNLFFHNNISKINIDEAQKAAKMTDVMRMLIKYQKILWTIPAFMVSQIRLLYEEAPKNMNPKNVRKIITKRMKTDGQLSVRTKISGSSGDELDEVDENCIIKIKAPSLNKQSMAIQLTERTTAGDVLAKFQWRRQHSVKEKDEIDTSRLKINKSNTLGRESKDIEFFLCECGGNIGERRLEPSTNLYAILRVNPNVRWVIQGRRKR